MFFRNRSRSDVSRIGIDPLSPFHGTRSDFLNGLEALPNSATSSRHSFFPEPMLRQSSIGSLNQMLLDDPPNSLIRMDSRCHYTDITQTDQDWTDMDYSHTSTDDFSLTERPWETIPLENLNSVPAGFEHLLFEENATHMRLGWLKGILINYLRQVMLAAGVAPDEVKVKLKDRSPSKHILNLANEFRLMPLVARLHLENEGHIGIPPEHDLYRSYIEERRRVRTEKSKTSQQEIEENVTADAEGNKVIQYFQGIRLMLGKERDSVIRPMITSIFRENREQFRSALLDAGLKYNELRIWTDAQLCTAIHIADSFRPGIWEVATGLHQRKCNKRANPPRKKHRRTN